MIDQYMLVCQDNLKLVSLEAWGGTSVDCVKLMHFRNRKSVLTFQTFQKL